MLRTAASRSILLRIVGPGHRKLLMGFLLSAFAIQTTLVYSDSKHHETPPLDAEQLAGRALWHRHNCQVCHQIYGFGGFLGPDLTNAASRLTRGRIDDILTNGAGQMPAFGFAEEEIDAIHAWLIAIDETGVGQARRHAQLVDIAAVDAILDQHATEGTLVDDAARGRMVFRTRCTSCHRLFQGTPLGFFMAPDLTNVADRLTDQELRDVIANGRPDRGMIPPPTTDDERTATIAFLHWLADQRDELAAQLGVEAADQSLPWFEFK